MTLKLYEKLVELPYLNLYKKLLFTALDLNLFYFLKESKSSKELACELDLHEKNCQYFLNALYSMELLEKNNNKFKNTPDATKYLSLDSPYYFGDVLRVASKINDVSNINFKSMIENGPISEVSGSEISFDEMFQDMKDSQSAIRVNEIKNIIINLEEYPKINKILDLGCGAGLLGLSIIDSRDDMTGVLFDKPPMAPLINQCVSEKELEGKTEVRLGDFIEDDIGSGYDLVLTVGTLNFAKYAMEHVFKKVYNSLNDDGVFVVVLDEIEENYSHPKEFVTSWVPYAFNGMDLYMEKGLVQNEAINAGFNIKNEENMLLAFGHFNVIILKK